MLRELKDVTNDEGMPATSASLGDEGVSFEWKRSNGHVVMHRVGADVCRTTGDLIRSAWMSLVSDSGRWWKVRFEALAEDLGRSEEHVEELDVLVERKLLGGLVYDEGEEEDEEGEENEENREEGGAFEDLCRPGGYKTLGREGRERKGWQRRRRPNCREETEHPETLRLDASREEVVLLCDDYVKLCKVGGEEVAPPPTRVDTDPEGPEGANVAPDSGGATSLWGFESIALFLADVAFRSWQRSLEEESYRWHLNIFKLHYRALELTERANRALLVRMDAHRRLYQEAGSSAMARAVTELAVRRSASGCAANYRLHEVANARLALLDELLEPHLRWEDLVVLEKRFVWGALRSISPESFTESEKVNMRRHVSQFELVRVIETLHDTHRSLSRCMHGFSGFEARRDACVLDVIEAEGRRPKEGRRMGPPDGKGRKVSRAVPCLQEIEAELCRAVSVLESCGQERIVEAVMLRWNADGFSSGPDNLMVHASGVGVVG
jgi:hypothetical protein